MSDKGQKAAIITGGSRGGSEQGLAKIGTLDRDRQDRGDQGKPRGRGRDQEHSGEAGGQGVAVPTVRRTGDRPGGC